MIQSWNWKGALDSARELKGARDTLIQVTH